MEHFQKNFEKIHASRQKAQEIIQNEEEKVSYLTKLFHSALSKNEKFTRYFLLRNKQITELSCWDEIFTIKEKKVGILGLGLGYIINTLEKCENNFYIFDNNLPVVTSILHTINLQSENLYLLDKLEALTNEKISTYLIAETYLNFNNTNLEELTLQLEGYASQAINPHTHFYTPNNNTTSLKTRHTKSLKVLIQARSNLFKDKGGDTVALVSQTNALKKLNCQVTIDCDGKENPKDYDIGHIYNLATPEAILPHAMRFQDEKVPYVVTTLYEDREIFFPKLYCYGSLMEKYLRKELTFDSVKYHVENLLKKFPDGYTLNNDYVVANAKSLLASGKFEKDTLVKKYPFAQNIDIIHFGANQIPHNIDPTRFLQKHGLSKYIICVGRIEWRKNQAMLLKALEDEDIDIVFVAGNMTYQPEYESLIRDSKRKGRNIFLSGLSAEELACAYKGALAHVLPSWYELPGLVSLEAAQVGTPVVATMIGTTYDYFGDLAFYCEPSDPESIRDATFKAIASGKDKKNLIEKARSYTWERSAENLLSILNKYAQGAKALNESITIE